MSIVLLQQPSTVARDQLREQIKQTIQDARIATEEAAAEAKQARGTADRTGISIGLPASPGQAGSVQTIRLPEIPPQVEPISIAFFAMIAIIVVGLPIMRAIARRIDRGTPVAAPIPRAVSEQLQQISHSVDAIAIEVERISEGQRFTTKMLNDRQRDITTIGPASPSQSQG